MIAILCLFYLLYNGCKAFKKCKDQDVAGTIFYCTMFIVWVMAICNFDILPSLYYWNI